MCRCYSSHYLVDTALLPSNLLQRFPQYGGMVNAEGRNSCDYWLGDNVCAIIPPSHTDFQDGCIHLRSIFNLDDPIMLTRDIPSMTGRRDRQQGSRSGNMRAFWVFVEGHTVQYINLRTGG